MKYFIAFMMLLAFSAGCVSKQVPDDILPGASASYSSKEECEQALDCVCDWVTCDVIPEGKTYEEVCGEDFKKGWQCIDSAPATSASLPEPGSDPASSSGGEPESSIKIVDEDRICASDEECVAVAVACGDCGYDAVNRAHKEKYEELLAEACVGFDLACDSDYRETHEVRCPMGFCALVPK